MSDTDDDFDKAFEGFGEDPAPVTPPVTPPADDPAAPTPPVVEPPKVEEPKKDDDTPPVEPPKSEEGTPPTTDAPKAEEGAKPPETTETPPASEEPKPLTLEDVKTLINDVRSEERTSGQALENQTKEVLEAYYPDGLSNVLTTPEGKELKTPQDVVDATDGSMTLDQAANWLMNEQFKLDKDVEEIKAKAVDVAKTTLKFKQDSIDVIERYEPLFKAYPQVQQKVWSQYEKLMKVDKEKGVVLSAPDMREFYDTMLDPYRMAMELGAQQPATAPVASDTPPPAPTPTAEDRLDETGDGGQSPVNDPNDFAQQVKKELAKGEV